MLNSKSIKLLKKIAKQYRLKVVILFGGFQGKLYDKNSDIDIAILPENNNFLETDELSDLIYDLSKVEDNEKRDIDVVPISCENPILLYNIIKFGVPIYLKSKDDYIRLINWARFTFEDNFRLFGVK